MTDSETLHIDWIEAEAHFWSLRWLFVLGLVLASGVAAFNVWRAPPPQTSYNVLLEVHSAGTPVRGASEISDILRGSLAGVGVAVTSARTTVPLLVQAQSEGAVQSVLATVQKVADQLDAEVQTRMADLANVLGANDAALTPYLNSKTYLEARKAGMVHLIRPVISQKTSSALSLMKAVGMPIFLSLIIFIAIGLISYACRRWMRFKSSAAAKARSEGS